MCCLRTCLTEPRYFRSNVSVQGLGSWGRNYLIYISNEECSCFQLLALDRWVTFVYGNVSSYTVTYAQV